jgi:hypothetical protein
MSRWILCTWNGEIPAIIELPPIFSVEIAVAGAKKGCFWIEMQGSLCQGVVVWYSNANRGYRGPIRQYFNTWFHHGSPGGGGDLG